MADRELVFYSMVELADLIRRKKVSPVEVARAYLDRAQRLDSVLRAYITVTAEDALKEARRAEKALTRRGTLRLLHGLPLALKDLAATKGIRTTCGSKILANWVPDEDATIVVKFREAGAVLLGKLNMHEFAYGPEGFNPHYGMPQNPWDKANPRYPGGSSSGSGVAVAAALCAGAIGTDTGGSIRIPASLCGIAGIKPTYGRVSRYGIVPLSWSMDHAGPMTRTVADSALMLQAMAGYDPKDASSSPIPVPNYLGDLEKGVKGLRVGIPKGGFFEALDPEVGEAVHAAIGVLRKLGARVGEVSLPHIHHTPGVSFAIVSTEAVAYHEPYLKTRAHEYGEDVRARLLTGQFVLATQYLKAQRARTLLRQEVETALRKVDVMVLPTTPIPAPKVDLESVTLGGESYDIRSTLTRLTRLANVTGHPALSVPCGFTSERLPIGLQILGRAFDEATVLRVGHAYERATPWHNYRPPLS